MAVKSFEEYFAGYSSNFGEEGTRGILADAQKVLKKCKCPEAVEEFQQLSDKEQFRLIPDLDVRHSIQSMEAVCTLAQQYATYRATQAPYTFDEYFADYQNYDKGGKADQRIVAEAKKVFTTLKTPDKIEKFYASPVEERKKMVTGLSEDHSGASFHAVCRGAYVYAEYAQKYIKGDKQSLLGMMAANVSGRN